MMKLKKKKKPRVYGFFFVLFCHDLEGRMQYENQKFSVLCERN